MSKQSGIVKVSQGADGDPLFVDSANNRVGIGTSSPYTLLELSSTDPVLRFNDSNGGTDTKNFEIRHVGTNSPDIDGLYFRTVNDANTVYSDKMVLLGNGNVLVGTTNSSIFNASSGTGMVYRSGVALDVAREATGSGQPCVNLNMTGTDGDHIIFYKDGSAVGRIGNSGSRMFIGTGDTGLFFADDLDSVIPWNPSTNSARDNAIDLGWSSGRFDDIYATNGTIQTSDRNEKQDIDVLSEAERRVAQACKGLLRKFRWKSAVAEKGDDARIHFGIIAQDLQAAFEAEGLDAGRYAMFISSTWWEADGHTYETAEEAPEGAVERTRLGVRYPELLAFIIGAM